MTASKTLNNPVHAKKKPVVDAAEEQFGFSFADDSPVFAELADGAWLMPQMTAAGYVAAFDLAEAVIPAIEADGVARGLFVAGLQVARAELAKMEGRGLTEDGPFRLWRTTVALSCEVAQAFFEHCQRNIKTGTHEYKVRSDADMQTAAMFVEGAGCVVVRVWGDDSCAADYHPAREPFLLDSYRDTMREIEAPARVFMPAYCGDKIATSSEGAASVPTFSINGREYVNSGSKSHGRAQSCTALTFCPAADWRGPAYSYRTQIEAWDAGRVERGDKRGLRLTVRGRPVVVDGVARVYDNNAAEYLWLGSTEPDDTAEEDDEEPSTAE